MSHANKKVITFKNGSKVHVPASWSILSVSDGIHLMDPERELSLYLLEGPLLEDLSRAADEAWKRIKPNFDLKHVLNLSMPVSGNWEKGHQVVYEIPASEFRMVVAYLRVFEDQVYILLVDGTTASLSRRGAEIGAIFESLKPPGFQDADLRSHSTHEWNQSDRHAFDCFVSEAMQKLGIPGASIAIVRKDGTSIFRRAFGVKKLGEADPVTLDTPFMIGSTTKALTTLMAAKLVEQEKLSWETPVTKMLPHFKIADAELTQQMTLRHTFSASTGMPQRDYDWIFKYRGVTPEMRLAQMEEMKPTTRVGEIFQYSNYLFMVGGYAAARVFAPMLDLEQGYSTAMANLVLEPLQMTRTVLETDKAIRLGAAVPHSFDFQGKIEPLAFGLEESCYSVAPAGAVWSTVDDMTQYLLLEMNNGILDGKRVISECALLERRKPGIRINDKLSYGLGLMMGQEQGLDIVRHGGSTLGFSSDLFFLPSREIGVVILTNMRAEIATSFLLAVRQKFMEITFGAQVTSDTLLQTSINRMNSIIDHNLTHIVTDPAHTACLEQMTGLYESPNLGKGRLSKIPEDGGYEMDFGEWKSRVGISKDPANTLRLVLTQPPSCGGLKFLVADEGNRLTLDGLQERYEFLKIQETGERERVPVSLYG